MHDEGRYHMETIPLIFLANQWTGFHMITASIMNELKHDPYYVHICMQT